MQTIPRSRSDLIVERRLRDYAGAKFREFAGAARRSREALAIRAALRRTNAFLEQVAWRIDRGRGRGLVGQRMKDRAVSLTQAPGIRLELRIVSGSDGRRRFRRKARAPARRPSWQGMPTKELPRAFEFRRTLLVQGDEGRGTRARNLRSSMKAGVIITLVPRT